MLSAVPHATAAAAQATAGAQTTAAAWAAANPYFITAIASVIAATTAQAINVVVTWRRERSARLRREERMKQIFRSLIADADTLLSAIVNKGVVVELEVVAVKIAAVRSAVQELTPLLDLEPVAIQQLFTFVGTAEVALRSATFPMKRFDETFEPEEQTLFDEEKRESAIRQIRFIFSDSLSDAVLALGALDADNTGAIFERNTKAALADPQHPENARAKNAEAKGAEWEKRTGKRLS